MSEGKNRIIFFFSLKKQKGKNRIFIENFPVREKIEYLSSFSQGRKSIYTTYIYFSSVPYGHRVKKCGGSSCRHTRLFPLPVTNAKFLKRSFLNE